MNHDGLEQNLQPINLAEILGYTIQSSLVICYNKEWLKGVEMKGLLIWRDIEKAIALMCSR